jgi:hypothetical protein
MTVVTKEFIFYDAGTFPVLHEVGEEVTGEVEAYAISQGFTGDGPADPLFEAKHRGGGVWDVFGPEGKVAADLDKLGAKAKADELNGVTA